ncbi:ATP-binding protein [Halobaculum sp. MBLA0147]|uniref:ATP-binding protein n=1 Tax=Halobaculum sp. MBLA0147 TaxID=3079934 RepID=UPI00352516ED
MSQVERQELEEFRGFYRRYYEDDIAELAQRYPNEQRSLYVEYDDLYRFDAELAERYLNKPEDMREIAEEALRTYDLPADVSLGQAHVRLRGLPASNTIDIRNIRVVDDHIGSMVAVQGIVRKATDVRPKIVEAAFECQRCGTMTYIPQSDSGFQEPHECQGCERQGPFRINHDQSEFVDAQTIRVQESPEGLRGGETPQAIDVYLEDDVCGEVTPGDHVSVAGVLHIEQQTSGNEKTALFDLYMDGVTVTIEDEEFEDMDISDEDVAEILELADSPDIYEKMVDSVAPSIYGYEQEKLAIVLQLFGGVTKHLPDESRIRGDLHMLLIGDPGTGKSQLLSYTQNIAPRSVYTSGKGSSAAGLCVTGDTLVHTTDGIRRIEDIVTPDIPESVETETAVERALDLYTYDEATGETTVASTSHVWRMPPKPCRRIETASGTQLETSRNTPVLTCGDDGPEWTPISEVEAGDHVGTPNFDGIERSSPATDESAEDPDGAPAMTDGAVGSTDGADLEWDRVVTTVDTGEKELYDLTVPETNNFVANGVVTHNTAAAVRDDFGDGQQWTLEAGALVLADKGIAAIDELDKMAEDDRSAMHEALEQQSISISKAGINATLKSRCSLLGAANPKYGRFDQYEPIGEQIDLEPALISRFDLIFTVTDQPDPDHDAKLADHILTTNYAGELNTQQTEMTNSEVTRQQVEDVQEEVAPVVDAELLRKYVAYSKRNCFPRMTDAARDAIQEFYVDLRSKGADEDAPVPVTARKLEATVRLAEASARVRLADEVTADDAERVIEIVRSCLQDIGVDPETGEFDADVVETGTSKSQRDRIKNLKDLLREVDEEYEDEPGAPRDQVLERADEVGMDRSKVEDEIEKLKTKGDLYMPDGDHIKVV